MLTVKRVTLSVEYAGTLQTVIPRSLQALRSILSKPVAKIQISFNFGAFFNTSLVILTLFRTRISASLILSSISLASVSSNMKTSPNCLSSSYGKSSPITPLSRTDRSCPFHPCFLPKALLHSQKQIPPA